VLSIFFFLLLNVTATAQAQAALSNVLTSNSPLASKRSGMADINDGSHCFTCHLHVHRCTRVFHSGQYCNLFMTYVLDLLSCTDSGCRRVLIAFGWWLHQWTRVCDKPCRPPTGQMQCGFTTKLQWVETCAV